MKCASVLPVILMACAPAIATEVWISTEPRAPTPGQEITVRLLEGDGFQAAAAAFDSRDATLFQRVWRRGRQNLTADEGGKASRFRIEDPGVHLVVYSSEPAGRPAEYCKSVLVAGDAASDDPVRYSEVGQRLEIVPQTDPVKLLREGGRLQLQVLFEREPLAGVAVTALSEEGEGADRSVTDEIGLATVRLDRPGRWLVRVAHRDERGGGLSSTLVLSAKRP